MKSLSADEVLHASCVGLDGDAVLILGKSGAGKSALALTLMAYGAQLVADDRVVLRPVDGRIIASAPDTIAGLIEARGVGIFALRSACSDCGFGPERTGPDTIAALHDRSGA